VSPSNSPTKRKLLLAALPVFLVGTRCDFPIAPRSQEVNAGAGDDKYCTANVKNISQETI
jgi:hypothetical protein